jgi:hypothetical protein
MDVVVVIGLNFLVRLDFFTEYRIRSIKRIFKPEPSAETCAFSALVAGPSGVGVDMQATCVCATSVCQIGNICFLITPDGGNLPSWGYRETKRVIETRTVTTAIRNGSCMLIEENSQEFCIFCI